MKKIAVINDASPLLGDAIALQICERMDVLVISEGGERSFESASTEPTSVGRNRYLIRMPQREEALSALFDFLNRRSYWVHTLVNVLGVITATPSHDDDSILMEEVDCALSRAFHFARAVAEDMVIHRQGVLVNVAPSSLSGDLAGTLVRETLIGGVEGMTRSLLLELGPRGVRVNCVIPGHISDEPFPALPNSVGRKRAGNLISVMGRSGRADEVADVVEFLVSERSSYVNGVTLKVDGGRHF